MLKAVIFDVDGTLIDSVDAHACSWQETLADFGYRIPLYEVRDQIGKGGDQLLRTFLSEAEARDRGEKIEAARKKRFTEHYLAGVRAFPNVRELFQRLLFDGRQVVLATSAAGDELRVYKEKAEITDLVSEETSRDDAKKSKPHPDIFNAALRKLEGVSKENVVVVGDSPWDAIAARKAGIHAIGVECGGFPVKKLRDAGFKEIYRNPHDILENYRAFLADCEFAAP